MESKREAAQIRFKHAHVQKEIQGKCVKISILHPLPTYTSSHTQRLWGSGTCIVGEGVARGSGLLSVQIQFAKKVNVDSQCSWRSIKQMSLKHNQISTTVIPHVKSETRVLPFLRSV